MPLQSPRLLSALAATLMGSAAQAGVVTQTATDLLSPLSPNAYVWMRAHSQVGYDALPNLMDQSGSFQVIDNGDAPAVTSHRAQAGAVADYTRLAAWASVSVDNPMSARGVNPPYADPDGNLIPGGVPQGYGSMAFASVNDVVHVTAAGGAAVASLRFELAYDGSFSGTDHGSWVNSFQEASIHVEQYANGFRSLAYHGYNGSYDASTAQWSYPTQTIQGSAWSVAMPVVNGQTAFNFFMTARAYVGFYDSFVDGGSFQVNSDFGSTLHIVRAHAYDAAGRQVALQSVLGNSGTSYAISAVPEPSTWLLCLGGLLVGAMKLGTNRRRQASS